jgi:hypothetical protein
MAASGGGDGPEEVACAFHDVLHLPWRDDATKICIFITDAPPHGLVRTHTHIRTTAHAPPPHRPR